MGMYSAQSKLWARYRVSIQFRDKVMGGVPHDPKLIEGWLRSKAGVNDDELRAFMLRTLTEMGVEVTESMTLEDMEKASSKIAGLKETTGFKRDDKHGLYIESRQVKAGLKESVNILYAGDKEWLKHQNNPTRKGARSFLAERVFVSPDEIYLGVDEPSGVEMVIGHVTGPQGPRSTLGYHEYVSQAEITFDVLVARDLIPNEWWPDLWEHFQENGLGALRSQGHGRFDIWKFDPIDFTASANGVVDKMLASVH